MNAPALFALAVIVGMVAYMVVAVVGDVVAANRAAGNGADGAAPGR
jgi:hypothetical protein